MASTVSAASLVVRSDLTGQIARNSEKKTNASTLPFSRSSGQADNFATLSSAISRRDVLSVVGLTSLLATPFIQPLPSSAIPAQSLPQQNEEEIKICSSECEAELDNVLTVTTASGLQYKDIVVGKGPSPPVGFQVAADAVAMLPNGRVFDSSIEKKMPYIFRVGAGQVVAGLDEGVLSMKVGGVRRLYIPGELAFPKGLSSAAGRPRVPPSSPIMFDVKLLYIPGLELDDEDLE